MELPNFDINIARFLTTTLSIITKNVSGPPKTHQKVTC